MHPAPDTATHPERLAADAPSPGLSPDEIAHLGRRARFGVAALIARTVLVQLVVLGGRIGLARILVPGDFGIFAALQSVLTFFLVFGDAGIGAALIQKKDEPTREELSSVFFAQLIFATVIMAIVFAVASFATDVWPDLPASTPWLLRVFSLELLLTALRTVPSIIMERKLMFGRLGAIDVSLNAAFYVSAVALAWMGLGVWALIGATLIQAVTGVVLAFAAQPFRPVRALRWSLLRPILRFGVPFQLKMVVGYANGAITPLYGNRVLGKTPVGYIVFAQDTAYFPLRLVEIMTRVSFPLFSRMQADPQLLADAFSRTVQICAVGTFFFSALCFGMGSNLIHVVFTDKWMASLPLLHVFAGAIAVGFLSPLVNTVLDATGRPKIFLRFMVGWTLLNWIVVPIAAAKWGMTGFGAGYAVHVVVGNLVVLALLPRLVPKSRLYRRLFAPLVAAVLVYLVGAHLAGPHAFTVLSFVASIVALLLLYVAAIFVLDRRGLIDALAVLPVRKRGGTSTREIGEDA